MKWSKSKISFFGRKMTKSGALILHIDGRQNVKIYKWCTNELLETAQYFQNMKYQVKQMLQTQEIGQKPRFYTFWRRRYAKKICSQIFFDLKFSGNVKSGLKSLNSKFQSIWKILSWPKWSKTMILATLSLNAERQEFSRTIRPCNFS